MAVHWFGYNMLDQWVLGHLGDEEVWAKVENRNGQEVEELMDNRSSEERHHPIFHLNISRRGVGHRRNRSILFEFRPSFHPRVCQGRTCRGRNSRIGHRPIDRNVLVAEGFLQPTSFMRKLFRRSLMELQLTPEDCCIFVRPFQ